MTEVRVASAPRDSTIGRSVGRWYPSGHGACDTVLSMAKLLFGTDGKSIPAQPRSAQLVLLLARNSRIYMCHVLMRLNFQVSENLNRCANFMLIYTRRKRLG